MEELKDRLMQYEKIIQQRLLNYAESKPADGELEVETIFDPEHHHYQILNWGWQHNHWVYPWVFSLALRNQKIWIFYNSTEPVIASDLVDLQRLPIE
jgi:XisI protein